MKRCYWIAMLLVAVARPAVAQSSDTEFFEAKIRPVLVQRCYGCHSSKLASPKGDLTLDTKAGVLKGGHNGPAIVSGKPAESLLYKALTYAATPQMPPTGKLPDAVVADFERWIAMGAPDPRTEVLSTSTAPPQYKGMSIEDGRKWWAFQPVKAHDAPAVQASRWPKTKADAFVLAKQQEQKLTPSPQADRRTLAIRAYVDLVGYRPSYEELQAFLNDRSPNAYDALIDRLLASPHYGERWGRHWMDVARYGEDNPSSEATNPPYAFAYRYRDWIVESVNADVPYDRFVKLQLAADLMTGTTRDDLRALGYLGAAPVYHKDQRLSGDIIGGFFTDDWDERIDAVGRGILGLSAGCARCHDHKFDPITQKDYYSLMGVFASTTRAERPLFDVPPAVEMRYLTMQRRLFDLAYSINLIANERSTIVEPEKKEAAWKAEVDRLKVEATTLLAPYPVLLQSLERYWTPGGAANAAPAGANNAPQGRQGGPAPQGGAANGPQGRQGGGGRGRGASDGPFTNAVYEAALFIDASDPSYTFPVYKPGETRDMPVLKAGNYAAPGAVVPRGFLAVLANGDARFVRGSGRQELADRIFSDSPGLAARVIVNRVWGWHFGRGIVTSPSDFGTQGDKPTHPELLDDLAARFIEHGWSLKWLNKEIMLSAAYQQSSAPRPEALEIDQPNSLLWRMSPQRLDAESYRDSLVRSAGLLDERMGGAPGSLDDNAFYRRAVYGQVSRSRPAAVLTLFDFPDPLQSAPDREVTVTSLQQIFTMNSPFMQNLAAAAAKQARTAAQGDAEQLGVLYRRILSRTPTPAELKGALEYLQKGTLERYAQALLSTNEEIVRP
jgi:hypothetical protein